MTFGSTAGSGVEGDAEAGDTEPGDASAGDASADDGDRITGGMTGIVLAAGAGSRMGRPKALLVTDDGTPWVQRACRVLLDAGCERVVVVLGASADEARALVPLDVAISTVVNDRWTTGMAGSLSVGLASATGDAALVLVVDMPDLPVSVVERIVAKDVVGTATAVLARTVYSGAPGHPVLIGRDHWGPVRAYLDGAGDRGAKAYLDAHGVLDVECGDLYDGHDVDVPTVVGD